MASEKTPPIYRPRRNQRKLDLRPAIWRLRNYPEEWKWDGTYLTHNPSRFYIRLERTRWDGRTNNNNESFGVRQLLWRDRRMMLRAFRQWKRKNVRLTPSAANLRFAAQFTGKDGGYDGEIRLPTGEVLYQGPFPVDPDQVYAYMTAQRLAADD